MLNYSPGNQGGNSPNKNQPQQTGNNPGMDKGNIGGTGGQNKDGQQKNNPPPPQDQQWDKNKGTQGNVNSPNQNTEFEDTQVEEKEG